MEQACPNCRASGMDVFYESRAIPVHSCVMLNDRRAAAEYPRRDLALGFCPACGFISNVIFDPSVQDYAGGYEEQQSFSPRFRAFQSDLITRLVERYDLRGKDVVEIGCGKGDFLVELCEAGGNRGVGIDPTCDPARVAGSCASRVRFIPELYSDSHADLPCDLLCCRHTLEHIHPTNEFVRSVRRVVGAHKSALVFFEVPDVVRVLRERAFWDIYYEHCSYFSLGSLGRVFRDNAFELIELAQDYDDQYLLLVARPADGPTAAAFPAEHQLAEVSGQVKAFAGQVSRRIEGFRRQTACLRSAGKRLAIWGGGSKCVSFLSTVGIAEDVAAVVDINPYRQGKFLAGSGTQVVGPEALRTEPVDAVLVMNPIYGAEIQQQLDAMGVAAELILC